MKLFKKMKIQFLQLFLSFVILLLFSENIMAAAMPYSSFIKRPKLILLIVIDQFRADYLTRFEDKFIPPGDFKTPGGFRFLMEKGAYYPFAEYLALQNMTCPGHAMISTGSGPHLNGIILNEWFSEESNKLVYCINDSIYGKSPRNLMTTTFGDELKNVHPNSKVVTLSMKDRSAIMMGGHRADLALWIDSSNFKWSTSTFYPAPVSTLLNSLNEKLLKSGGGSKEVGLKKLNSSPLGVTVTVDAALEIMKEMKLGQGKESDVFTISLSTHDILGHQFGPNAKIMEDITITEDGEISRLLKGVAKQLGSLNDVVISLTADHGMAPSVANAKEWKFDPEKFDYSKIQSDLNSFLNKKYNRPEKTSWISSVNSLHFYLDRKVIEEKGKDGIETTFVAVQNDIKQELQKLPGIFYAFTKSEFLKREFSGGIIGQNIDHSYHPALSGDVVALPLPYSMEKGYSDGFTTHMTNWSYDRAVPLIIVSPKFKKGVYFGARVIDWAPTMSAILGVLPPAMCEGRVLSEIF